MANHLQPLPQVQTPGSGTGAPGLNAPDIPSEIPAPPTKLSARERKVWTYVTKALLEYGLVHRTDGMTLSVICRTFVRWAEAEEQLSEFVDLNDGSYIVKTPNGYEQPHQLFFLTSRLRKDLLQWLPEAALTIPAFAKAIDAKPTPVQGTLFEDPVEAHRRRKTAIGMRAV